MEKGGNASEQSETTNVGGKEAKFDTLLDVSIFPKTKSGLLVTYHIPDYSYVFQMYYPAGSTKFYKRNWINGTMSWSNLRC
ncbi:hypothetical protein bcere0022_30270 [Bacillus cereus Rock3-44]|nr:hypothetical protein bcere0022_30270 [Bacillus cereus Rock3-44]